ncbi:MULTISPECIES: glycosyltransferase [Pantoea]|nr:glycosyltransferase [Pantoea brenneri]OXM19828.1 glycosyltransferase [Pantoea sp. AV62]
MVYDDEANPFRFSLCTGANVVMSALPLLSIITPMYNAGSMFDEFMQSLLAQTLTSLEIIIVDDGSTDGSGERADYYAQHHSHVRVIHQENGGVSRARNAGLAIAQGKYVTFPDADDTMQPEMYQTLVTLAEQDDLDAAQCNAEWYFKHSQRVKPLIPLDRLRSTGVLSGPDWLNTALKTHRYMHVVWLGIYRRALIEQHQLLFEPGLHHQDIPWTTEFMLLAKRVRYTDAVLYRYYMHDASISNRKRTGQRNVEYQRHYLKIAAMLEALNHRYRGKVKIYPSFHYQVTHEALSVCHSVRREPDSDARRAIIADLFASQTHRRMLRNARGIKQWYQLLLWLSRLYRWRYK